MLLNSRHSAAAAETPVIHDTLDLVTGIAEQNQNKIVPQSRTIESDLYFAPFFAAITIG
jgi:hypothetical protein